MPTVVALVVLVLGVYALVDCLRTQSAEVRGLPVPAWIAIIVFLPLVGALAWLVAGRSPLLARQPAAAAASGTGTSGATGTAPSGPIGPDDDPDFLRSLDRRHRGEA